MSDKRSGSTGLHLVIQLGRVSEVRTIAYGDRLGLTDRVNNPVHLSIRANSPVGPASQPASETSVLRKDLIDNYTFFLDRHPGRRVDVAVSAGPAPEVGQPPTVTLDYLVTEAKPWYVYANYSNTGTRQTEAWRTKFGFVDNELTNNDDIFSIDYDFASVNTSEEVTSSYELPVSSDGRVRARIYGLADKYVASDVGLANEDFRGTEQMFGSEAIWNFLQYKQLFVDMFGGGRYQHFKVDQEVSGGSAIATGSAAYAVPYAGLRLVRSTDPMTTVADVTVLGGFSERGKDELAELGRLDPTKDWLLLQSDVNQSFYLEPIAKALGLPTKDGSLANEVAFYGRYQEAFGARLVPQFEQTAGGFYTVRGYQESATAGDRVFIGTAEYRFHLPRYLDLQPTPGTLFGQPFRYAPQQAFGPTDWDLIFRAFVDAARVEQDNRQSYESDDTLVSTGVGLELQVRQNLDIRADWGIALKGISDGTEAGSNRFHLSFTLLY
jgi:hemolysin activation/secretion protein